jgi:hypothetical protein
MFTPWECPEIAGRRSIPLLQRLQPVLLASDRSVHRTPVADPVWPLTIIVTSQSDGLEPMKHLFSTLRSVVLSTGWSAAILMIAVPPRVKTNVRSDCFRKTNTRIRARRSGFRCELGRSGGLHLQLRAAQTKQNCTCWHESADLTTPDGAPVAWVLRRIGHRDQERINGPDLMWNRI